MIELKLNQEFNERNIWSIRQNNPELVVQDLRNEFGLNDLQCEKVRFILMKRGVNKWLYARRHFIKLKHEIKELLKEKEVNSKEWRFLQWLNERMQNIAKTPRWVEFPAKTSKNWRNIEREIVVKGRHC